MKNFNGHFMSFPFKTKATQTGASVDAETIEQVKKTENALELMRFVDCFFVGCGKYSGSLVTFRKNSQRTYHFLPPNRFVHF